MISFRQADLMLTLEDRRNQEIKNQAMKWFADAAKGHHVYEHNFDDIDISGHTYEGMLQVVYDADYTPGSRGNQYEPDEPGVYEVAILNYILLPGDVTQDGERIIYNMDELTKLKDALVEIIDESMIDEDIQESLHQRDADSGPPDRDGEDR